MTEFLATYLAVRVDGFCLERADTIPVTPPLAAHHTTPVRLEGRRRRRGHALRAPR